MPILHYALGLRFGKVCEQNASKTRAKCEQNASKMRAKSEQNATDSRSCPMHSVIYKHFLALGSRFRFFSRFSCISRVFTRVLDTKMLVS